MHDLSIRGYERVREGRPETEQEREQRLNLESILNLALDELKDGRNPEVVAQALRNALVTA